jgi:hypothetical protein
MGAVQNTERRRPWEEKNAYVSGVLAYLIPGAGHAYQGRWFKACIYFVGILGTFFGGMKLGEGAVVYNAPSNQWSVSLNFLAQACVGLPALPAWQQAKRAAVPSNRPAFELTDPLSAPFEGQLLSSGPTSDQPAGELKGEISLVTDRSGNFPETHGEFRGTLDGEPVELKLSGGFLLDRPVGAGFRRKLECHLARRADQHPHASQMIRGSIPRAVLDAYAAPPDAATLQDLHGRLGKFYDLAIALTMIAGLLNILAIWDAVEGPAYGFGDEPVSAEATVTATTGTPPPDTRPPAGGSTPSIR